MELKTPKPAPASSPTVVSSQSSIVKHVPSRAKSIDQILSFAEKLNISNEMLIKVGLRMNGNLLFGSNHRCVAMLIVFKSIMDELGQDKELASKSSGPLLNELLQSLSKAIEFLDFCRPISVSMTNAHNLIKEEILKLNRVSTDRAIALVNKQTSQLQITSQDSTSPTSSTTQAHPSANQLSEAEEIYEGQKQQLKEFIDRFIDEEIGSAQRGICENIFSNIATNDVILVYGCSTIVQNVLLHAKTKGKTFKVIVVDSPPHFNGRRMLSFLNDNSIGVSYTLINSLSFVMRQATKVLLGANSMLANGYVMSHIGSSQLALMAKALNVPTIVCCETYKLSDRVYVDSFGCNEVDNGHELESALNLRYDLTPPEFISMVITEKSTVPAESVPALLRFRAEKTKTSLYST